tara:strand:+ start:497 stop:1285 length:789 start_codon:yes stop_codon:yes gene_type:complete
MKVLKLGQSLCSSNNQGVSFSNKYSLDFDGVDDYLSLGDSNTFSFGNGSSDVPFSYSIWYKASDVSNMPLISKTTAVSAEREYYMYIGSTDKIVFALFDTSSGGYMLTQTAAVTSTQGSWTHVVFTYAGNETKTGLKTYLNGSLQSVTYSADGATIGTGPYVAMENTAFPLNIAYFPLVGYTDGNFDETSMWNKELSASEVANIYNSGEPTDLSGVSGLIGWWRMGDPTGPGAYPTITDQSTNSNNATMTNMTDSDIVTVVP